MDEKPIEPIDPDQPRYQLRNRTTTVSSSSSQVTTMSHANLQAIVGCMAEGRSEKEVADASQGGSPLKECSSFPQYWRWNEIIKVQVQR